MGLEQLRVGGAGVDLAADAAGTADAPPILFLHGSGQTRQSWGTAVHEAAARGFRAIALDLRGHGDSGWSHDGQYSLDRFAADLREAIIDIGGEPVLVGASLGGMASLLVAAAPPPAVRALVLVDVTPRLEMNGAKEVMAFMDSAPHGFGSLDEAADAVAAYLPHRQRPRSTAGLQRNLRLRDGRLHWHWDPAFMRMGRDAEARYKSGTPTPLETAARALTVPTLLVRGRRSRIVSDDSTREFLEMVPHAEVTDIADAHHMVAGDANDAFNDAVFRFIGRHTGSDLLARTAT
ncbi:MAG: alpha/beta fold hydrolase [Gammaproteobacteria bacterium]